MGGIKIFETSKKCINASLFCSAPAAAAGLKCSFVAALSGATTVVVVVVCLSDLKLQHYHYINLRELFTLGVKVSIQSSPKIEKQENSISMFLIRIFESKAHTYHKPVLGKQTFTRIHIW